MRTIIVTFEQLPACVLSCYGSFQNQTTHFDAIAAVSETYGHYYVHRVEQTLTDLLPKVSRDELGLISDQDFSSVPDINSKHFPDLFHRKSEQLQEVFQSYMESILWFHCSCEELTEADLQEAIKAWDHDVDLPTEFENLELATTQLQAQGLSLSQCSRVIVTALSLAKDRFLGELWDAWSTVRQPDDRFVVSAVRGDQRLRVTTAEWITALSEPVTHLPLLVASGTSLNNNRFRRIANLHTSQGGLLALIDPDQNTQAQSEITYYSATGKAVRTQEWLLMHRKFTAEELSEDECVLFRKPEDIWETMDLAKQYPGLIEDYLTTDRLLS